MEEKGAVVVEFNGDGGGGAGVREVRVGAEVGDVKDKVKDLGGTGEEAVDVALGENVEGVSLVVEEGRGDCGICGN